MPGLANEMRPKTLSDYMGNDIKKVIFSRMKDESKYPHTILLYGERGCGKTTAARLFAKEYQCMEKVDGHACGECDYCNAIDEKLINGDSSEDTTDVGVIELDITQDSSKAAIESVLEEVMNPPMYPLKHIILILDECHMASKQAQNRLLKIAEEPPEHLVLIFCTTNPENMLETLKDRCELKLKVHKVNEADILPKMLDCCKRKGWKTSNRALKSIIKHCDRNTRRCWNDLEQIAENNGGVVQIEQVSEYFGVTSNEVYLKYVQAANAGLEQIMYFIDSELVQKDIELDDFLNGLNSFAMYCLDIRYYGSGAEDAPSNVDRQIKSIFDTYNANEMDTFLQIIEYCNNMIASSNKTSESLKMIIITTALRLGKLKYLSIGLQNERDIAVKENRAGHYKMVNEIHKQVEQSVSKEAANSDIMTSLFGTKVTEVTPGGNDLDLDIDDDDDEDDGDAFTDEELLKLGLQD